MKSLVIAEKPSVGRDIARVLNCNKKGNGFFEGDKYIVTWALGHLVTLADPESYDDIYKTWKIEDLPILPKYLKLVVIKKTSKQFSTIKYQLNRKDVNEIIIATDAGREGELVARWIIEKAHVKKATKRLWISSVTDKAIKDGFKSLKNGDSYINLYNSAVARSEADWVVGINATRALTTKHNSQLSCGRVQTPTLAIISRREQEIKTFEPKNYFGIDLLTPKGKFKWMDIRNNSSSTFKEEKIDTILKSLNSLKEIKIVDINETVKKSYPPKLYDLTELQRDCNRLFGYSPKETLNLMQKLYEQHKVLTYPRTDSRYISSDIVPTLKDRLRGFGVSQYSKFTQKLINSEIKGNKSFVDNSKVSDHHAIIPTEEKLRLGNLTDRERKVYDLVVKRFLSVLYPPFIYNSTTVKIQADSEVFTLSGKVIKDIGWKEIYKNTEIDDKEDGDETLAEMEINELLKVSRVEKTSGKTTPPSLFNEATLLSAMENPVKYMESSDKNLSKTLSETGGLGTVATRADIIDKLFNSFLIEKTDRGIIVTSKGNQLLKLAPKDLKSPLLTAKWEEKLMAISKGQLNKNSFINEMKDYTKEIVKEIKNSETKFIHDNLTRKKCPDCGKFLLEVKGKNGKMLVCQDRQCGYRKNLSRTTNSRCPNCHKKLELVGEGENQSFVCKCGHREKLSTFNKRKSAEKNSKVSKKEALNYMKKLNKEAEEDFESPFAALSKLKL